MAGERKAEGWEVGVWEAILAILEIKGLERR
jgi:hypothetical protein